MHNKWFSTVREFNWRLTQFNWLVDDRLIWEVEEIIEHCHTRAPSPPGPARGRGRGHVEAGRQAASERMGVVLILPLSLSVMREVTKTRAWLQQFLLALSSPDSPSNPSRRRRGLSPPSRLQLISLEHITYPASERVLPFRLLRAHEMEE
jgi:hypothetical protein